VSDSEAFVTAGIAVAMVAFIAAISLFGFHKSMMLKDRAQIVFVRGGPVLVWLSAMMTYPTWQSSIDARMGLSLLLGGLAFAVALGILLSKAFPGTRVAMARAKDAEARERDERDGRVVRRMGRKARAHSMGKQP
jgi:hypothetical protein